MFIRRTALAGIGALGLATFGVTARPIAASDDDGEAVFRRYVDDVINGANPDAIAELVADGFVTGDGEPVSPAAAVAKAHASVAERRASFSDYVVAIDAIAVDGDHVAARLTFRGTHDGPLMNYPPSGRVVENLILAFATLRDGRLQRVDSLSDIAAVLAQIGG
jgi:predicted ester cyclase